MLKQQKNNDEGDEDDEFRSLPNTASNEAESEESSSSFSELLPPNNTSSSTGYCVICWALDKPLEAMTLVTAGQCQHRACRTCLRSKIKLEIADGHFAFQCPACTQLIDDDHVRTLLLGGRDFDALLVAIETNRMRSRRDTALTPLLIEAARRGDLALTCDLVEQGADCNAVDEASKWSPLMFASRYGRLDVASFLVEQCGALVNFLAPNGWTPLLVAVEHGHLRVAEMLIERGGAHVNAKLDDDQTTPLIKAAGNGDWRLVKLLLDKEAAVNVRDVNGYTALIYAIVVSKNEQIVDLLLRESGGCDPDEDNTVGDMAVTPLMFASYHGLLPIVELLLSAKRSVNAVEAMTKPDGFTALHLAAMNNHEAVVDLLLLQQQQNQTRLMNNVEQDDAKSYLKYFHLISKLVEKKAEIERTMSLLLLLNNAKNS